MRNAHVSQDALDTFDATREFFCQRVFRDKFSFCKEAYKIWNIEKRAIAHNVIKISQN